MSTSSTSEPGPAGAAFVSYAEFGEQFFRQAVTAERLRAAVDLLAGQPIAVGPTGVGPGGLVKLVARGAIGQCTTKPVRGDVVSHRVLLPVALSFEVDLGLEVHRFKASLSVPLVLTARAVDGLKVFLDITPPKPREIGIDLQAQGLRASVLKKVAGVEGEVRRFVATYVAREIDKPYVREARTVDVAGAIDVAWSKIGPRGHSATADSISRDLYEAIQEEMRETSEGTR